MTPEQKTKKLAIETLLKKKDVMEDYTKEQLEKMHIGDLMWLVITDKLKCGQRAVGI